MGRRTRAQRPAGMGAMLPLVLVYLAGVGAALWTQRLPWWLLVVLPALNAATFVAYRQDKFAAQQDRWRIAESTLHLWSFAGGWIGAWLAQRLLRHKSRKPRFRTAFWFSVAAHWLLLAGWAWSTGPR